MDALRNTINTQSIKTKQIVFQYPDGSFPEPGALLNVTDTRGHTDWTRAPNLDSITLVDGAGNEGVVTYTYASGLLVNDIPVGGGSVTGGTNIQVSGGGVVDFDPTKGGGVDMLGAPMTNTSRVQFASDVNVTANNSSTQKAFHTVNAALGATAASYYMGDYSGSANGSGVEYDAASKTLSVNNPAFPGFLLPGQGIRAVGEITSLVGTSQSSLVGSQVNILAGPGAASIISIADGSTNTNTITMATPLGGVPAGTSTLRMTDGATTAAVSYTEINDKLTISCSENLSVVANNSAHTIEMGPTLGQVLVSTKDNPIVLRRNDALPSTAIQTTLKVDAVGVVQIGDGGVLTDPGLRFQGALNDATIQLDDATNVLNVTSVTNAPLQLNVPLNDGTGTAGAAGQILTSQGAGLPPIWAAGGGGGGGVILASRTYIYTGGSTQTATIDTTDFPGIPTSTPVNIRIYSRAGGGGGGGGAGFGAGNPFGGIMSGGGGGGGGAGYTQDYFFTVPYGESFSLDVGNGGTGGNGANIIFGAPSDGTAGGNNTIQSTFGGKTFSFITPGGSGGIAGTAGVGGGGDPAGDTAPSNQTGPAADVTPGGAGGGFYSGLAGAGDGSVSITDRNAGRGIAAPAATLLSGAGGGGGGGGAGSDGEQGGGGASGFIRIDIYA